MCLLTCASLHVSYVCPALCAQVAGQQGAYLAHLLNSGFTLGVGGYTQPPPWQVWAAGREEQ